MALTLIPAALLNAQDSQSRHPIVEILSQNTVPDIPFDGQFLTSETTNEQRSNVIYHNSGRLIQVYTFGTATFKFVYTDVDRSQFYSVTITPGTGLTAIEASLCELANGNIGIIYIADYSDGTHKLHRLVVSPTGVVIAGSGDTEIASYASANILGSPFVIRLASGKFLLVYTKVDSPNYKIMMRIGTTVDFLTWSDEAECVISGLTATRKRYNTSLLQVVGGTDAGKIFLWFDYEDAVSGDLERYNIFYSKSSVDPPTGGDWSAASSSITPYTTYGDIGKHPVAVQKAADQMTMAYTEQRGAIQMDEDTSGVCFDTLNPTDMCEDTVNRKLYVLSTYGGSGDKKLYGVLKIDIDSWSVEKCWGVASVPAFNAAFFNAHVWWDRHHGEQYLIPIGIVESVTHHVVSVVDGEANTITTYVFEAWSTYGLVKNVDLTLGASEELSCTWIDFASKKMWCMFHDQGSAHTVRVGWIDLTEVINPSDPASLYHWNGVIFEPGWTQNELVADPTLLILPDQDFIVVSFGQPAGREGATYPGHLKVYHLGDGGVYKDYKHSLFEDFPYHGLRRVACKNGKLYGGFLYEPDLGEVDKRGLCEINIATDAMVLRQPSWATLDEYGLNNIYAATDGRLFITTTGYGITIYNTVSGLWTIPFTNTTLPGLTLQASPDESYGPILYDEATGLVFTAPIYSIISDWMGLVCFSAYGYIRRAYKMEGTYGGGIWSFAAATQLVQGLTDYDLVMALDAATPKSIYAFWTNQALLELSIKWDKEASQFDISQFLIRGSELVVTRTINGDPATIEFEVSHGHLFDPHNLNSLWTIYLKKFRKLNLKFGEKVGINDYWQQAGVFFVKQVGPVNYERPQYPSIRIVAEDNLGMWEFANVVATEYYSTYPEDILEDLIPNTTNLTLSDIDPLLNFDDSNIIYQQWIETPVKDIIHQICERFRYYPRIDVNGKFTAKKISDINPIGGIHIYSDLTKIIRFSPDDAYSDYTNRIIVMGEGRDWLEVLYNEEPVGQSVTGASGWWGKRKFITVWYSADHSKQCRYPRMDILESVHDGPYLCKKGHERLWTIASDELSIVILVDGPNLVGLFIAAVIIYLVLIIVCGILKSLGWGIGAICSVAEAYAMFNLMEIVGTQGMYSYNFYAQPVGHVRQSFQANADDLTLQTEIGMLVEKKFEDPLCYTLAQCQFVADFEMMVTKLQRNRVTFEKLADLRDEEGDIIQVLHPFSGQAMRILITDLKRIFKVSSSPGSNDGKVTDMCEGWKL